MDLFNESHIDLYEVTSIYFFLQPWEGQPSNQLIFFSLSIQYYLYLILSFKICCYHEAFVCVVCSMCLSVRFEAPSPLRPDFLLSILRTQHELT